MIIESIYLLLNNLGNVIYQVIKLCAFQLHTLFTQNVSNAFAGVITLVRSEKKAHCSTSDSATNNGHNNVNRSHIYLNLNVNKCP